MVKLQEFYKEKREGNDDDSKVERNKNNRAVRPKARIVARYFAPETDPEIEEGIVALATRFALERMHSESYSKE